MPTTSQNALLKHASTVRNPLVPSSKVGRVVIGLGLSGFAANAAAALRTAGYDVMTANPAESARRAAIRTEAGVVIFPAATELSGGLLAMAKLVRSLPTRTRAVIVAPTRDAAIAQAAEFLGATFVAEADGVAKLVRAVTGG